jgi:hypothetical protein
MILSGGSAGGLAVFYNVDHLATLVAPSVRLTGFPDAGFFLDGANAKTGAHDYATMFQAGDRFSFWFSRSCVFLGEQSFRGGVTSSDASCFWASDPFTGGVTSSDASCFWASDPSTGGVTSSDASCFWASDLSAGA